jgi:SAM-dependent methyltransferase
LQITDLIPPIQLFSEYLYFSSFSEELLRHARAAAERYIEEFSMDGQSLVVEIASNDGYLLQNFLRAKIPCLGVEPAANIAQVAREKGIETLGEFFDRKLARRLAQSGRRADLILGNNVFAHVPDPNDFVAGLGALLKPGGRIILEFPYAADLIEHAEFDTIYHEHVFYFTLTALEPLFGRHGLAVYRAERTPIHGGSLRLFAGHAGTHARESSAADLLAEEKAKGVGSLKYYEDFAGRVVEIRRALCSLLQELRAQGKRVAAYGASAKGSTLMNFFGIGNQQIDFVVDRSPHKQGRLTPGTRLPILGVEKLVERQPDYTLLLTWNFAEEILSQQTAYREKGGKFIFPIPEVRVA